MTTTHGGRREGAGRKPGEAPQKLTRLAAMDAELQEIHTWLSPRQRTLALLDAAAVVRMEREMDIRVEFSGAALWGNMDPEAEGYDAQASANKFEETLTEDLENAFPRADVVVEQSINDRHSVDGMEDSDEAADVGEVISRVWRAFVWVVKS